MLDINHFSQASCIVVKVWIHLFMFFFFPSIITYIKQCISDIKYTVLFTFEIVLAQKDKNSI